MAVEPYQNHWPCIHPDTYVAPSADLIGRVTVHEQASIWYHATLRGDLNEITIGPRSNVQDNCVLHLSDDFGCHLGELVTVGHAAILHACTIKDEVLIGMGATILDGSVIGERSIIGAQSLITAHTVIPPGSLVLGSPARIVKTLSQKEQLDIKKWALKYVQQISPYQQRFSSQSPSS